MLRKMISDDLDSSPSLAHTVIAMRCQLHAPTIARTVYFVAA
jgi:hypothetical protein